MGITSQVVIMCDRCARTLTVPGAVQTSSIEGNMLTSFQPHKGWNTYIMVDGRNRCLCPDCDTLWQQMMRQHNHARAAFFLDTRDQQERRSANG